jgi:hypothetical protein
MEGSAYFVVSRLLLTPAKHQPHSMNNIEDYGLKAAALSGEGSSFSI